MLYVCCICLMSLYTWYSGPCILRPTFQLEKYGLKLKVVSKLIGPLYMLMLVERVDCSRCSHGPCIHAVLSWLLYCVQGDADMQHLTYFMPYLKHNVVVTLLIG